MNGQERRAWLDRQGQNALDALSYYLGPGVPVNALAQLGDVFNPVSDIGRAGTAMRGVVRPGASVSERVNALGNVATDMASVLAPVGGAAYADDAARGLSEALANWSMPADDLATRFVASEAGSMGPKTAGEAKAQEILDLLASGRAAEVTDDMIAAAEPQYLYRNYDLPMDEASRMARAREMGFDTDTPLYHGTSYAGDLQRLERGSWERTAGEPFYLANGQENPRAVAWVPSGRQQVWFTDDGAYADTYAQRASRDGGSVYPVAVKDAQPGSVVSEFKVSDPANIRSRFARFDPRLAHLRNLSAGVGGLGISVSQQSEQERSDDINAILAKYGVN